MSLSLRLITEFQKKVPRDLDKDCRNRCSAGFCRLRLFLANNVFGNRFDPERCGVRCISNHVFKHVARTERRLGNPISLSLWGGVQSP